MDPIVVVGGGIIGSSVAYHLSRRTDASARLYERAETLGTATTGKSSLGLREYSNDAPRVKMKRYGRRLYNRFLSAPGSQLQYESLPVLHLATTPEGRVTVGETQSGEHALGSPSEFVPESELRDALVLPQVDESAVTAALYRPNSGYFRPSERLVRAFAERAAAAGATVHLDTEVTDIVLQDGSVNGVVADGDRRPAGTVVAAAGPWNNELAAMAGIDLPLRQERLTVLELDPDRTFPRPLPKLRDVETGVSVRSTTDDRLLAYHAEPAADPYDAAEVIDPDEETSVPEEAKTTIRESIEELAPAVADASVASETVRYTSRTPDGNPIVGWTATPGFHVAALNSRGIQFGPAIGHIVTRQAVDEDPTEYYPDVSISRFDGHEDCRG